MESISKTCDFCKYWITKNERHKPWGYGMCKKIREKIECNVVTGWSGGYVDSIETDFDFGCNLWELFEEE